MPVEHPFLRTVALPRDVPAAGDGAVEAVLAASREIGGRARVELLAERWPGLRAALARAGFARTLAAPAMVARPCRRRRPMEPALRLRPDGTGGLADATLAVQHAVFGEPEPSPGERACWRSALVDGSVRTWLRLDPEGRPLAAASLVGEPPAVELAGVWTRPDARRRGLARAVCGAAIAAADSALVWSVPTSAGSRALLDGLGLVVVATFEAWERVGEAPERAG